MSRRRGANQVKFKPKWGKVAPTYRRKEKGAVGYGGIKGIIRRGTRKRT